MLGIKISLNIVRTEEHNLSLKFDWLSLKVVNFISVDVLFFQLEWNVSVSECFDMPFRGCTVYIYIFNKHNSNSR
jgi:hypothetical protein